MPFEAAPVCDAGRVERPQRSVARRVWGAHAPRMLRQSGSDFGASAETNLSPETKRVAARHRNEHATARALPGLRWVPPPERIFLRNKRAGPLSDY
jgi:hypothetical protein